jgi:hypothetical protein
MPLRFAKTASFFDCSAVSQIVVRFMMRVCANAIRSAIVRKYRKNRLDARALRQPPGQVRRSVKAPWLSGQDVWRIAYGLQNAKEPTREDRVKVQGVIIRRISLDPPPGRSVPAGANRPEPKSPGQTDREATTNCATPELLNCGGKAESSRAWRELVGVCRRNAYGR